VKENDLVITTPFSFIASANVILYERAIPIFVDVDPLTGNINPTLVAECVHDLTKGEGRKTKNRWLPPAIRNSQLATRHSQSPISNLKSLLPVHAFGQPADMDPLFNIAHEYNLAIIEDACEAIGAEYKGQRVGKYATRNTSHVSRLTPHAAVFAFYPNKQMTTGEGGMIVTDNDEWASLF
ncbi:MAG: DegT/DnrJ/EryC1/StrS family aminotransferase, partial [Anaerolineae bacterium]|nr:DegT/DnrJ/EryC1/StrS family aminotransferase [Anaerolineae bacterium]